MSRYYTTKSGQRIKFPDDATPQEMQAIADAHDRAAPGQIPVNGLTATMAILSGRTPELLPYLGGGLGGFAGRRLGPVGRISGAGIGGALGEAGREVYRGEPLDPEQITRQATSQAAFQGAGEAFGAVAGRMNRAFAPKNVEIPMRPRPIPVLDVLGKERVDAAGQPLVLLNERGQPIVVPGPIKSFQKSSKATKQAADAVVDVATHAVPGGAFARPLLRRAGGGIKAATPKIAAWLDSPQAKWFASHFPRGYAALKALSD